MTEPIIIPPEHQDSFRRLMPYIEGRLRQNPQVMEALFLFLKLGGEKLARVAVDAYNETQRLNDAETKKRQREEALLRENLEEEVEGEEGSDSDEETDDDKNEDEIGGDFEDDDDFEE
jgi:hypothetical protein